MSHVAILQESLEPYRLRFFDELHRILAEKGIAMSLWVYDRNIRKDQHSLPYLRSLQVVGSGRLSWGMLPKEVKNADLVIQPQQVRHLSFLLLLLERAIRKKRNAFWGHGKCFDPKFEIRLSEKLKRFLSTKVNWWFAYNDLSARIVTGLGFPQDRITSVMNSTDTASLVRSLERLRLEGLEGSRQRLGIGPGPVGVFLGRLYFNKRVDFTLEAAVAIRNIIPTFELIVIGEGKDRHMVEKAMRRHSWIHLPGALQETEKVPWLAHADILINPGVVGLVINDAMALGLPTLTTNYPTHSPEIDYLKEGVNGLISRPWTSVDAFVEMAVSLLRDPARLGAMKAASMAESRNYSATNMAERFASGIVMALRSNF